MLKRSFHFRLPALILFVSLFLSGCESKGEPKQPAGTPVMTLWYGMNSARDQEILANLIKGYNESQEDVILEAVYVPSEDMKKRVALSMADDMLPDLALIDSVDFMFLNSMEPFVDLTDKLPQLEHYMDIATIPCEADGRIYGLPFDINCPALFYNTKIFRESGCRPPGTWEEFYEAALKTSDGRRNGFAITALTTEETIYQFLPILWSMGGDLSSIDSPKSAEAFTLLNRLARCGAMDSQSVNLTMSDLLDQFVAGDLAMMIHSSMSLDQIRSLSPDLEFDVIPFPPEGGSVTVVGGEIFAVSHGTMEEWAVDFLDYLSDAGRMLQYLDDLGALAPREDVMERQFLSDPLKRRFLQIFKTARPREFSTAWPRISSAVTEAVGQVIIGGRPQEEILREAASKIQTIREEQP